jgi:hypothetical protein
LQLSDGFLLLRESNPNVVDHPQPGPNNKTRHIMFKYGMTLVRWMPDTRSLSDIKTLFE